MEYIAFDSHKHYTLASVARPNGHLVREQRLPHERGALQQFLARCEPGSPVAVETIGNWYWIVDEIEAAGCIPKLVHARKAKLMMGEINKTDKLDVRGLNQLQRNGTLRAVWIPPGELRDQRDLPRTRYLKWAFVEAANAICLNRGRAPRRHVSRLYERVARRKGHQKAIGAVARHLAEATNWILTKQESYREPKAAAVSSTGDKRG
jgi:hypothetical protein